MSTAIETVSCDHCAGTGRLELTPSERSRRAARRDVVLEELRRAGDIREHNSNARDLEGTTAREKAYKDIRRLAAEAEKLGLTRAQIGDAVGLKRAALYLVLSEKRYLR